MSAARPRRPGRRLEALWAHHHAELRDPHEVLAQWQPPAQVDPALLVHRVRGRFWEALSRVGSTVAVTREYEHLVMALAIVRGRPRISYLRLPHPNGMAVTPDHGALVVASTRNPNMLYDFAPASAFLARDGLAMPRQAAGLLLPRRARYLPGSLYVHDLAFIGRRLHANAVAMNAVVAIDDAGRFEPAWWPRAIDSPRGPRFGRNYLQLNSIAAGRTLRDSFFSASAAAPSRRRPGHLDFPVDGRGVIFSGRTREVLAGGLTRPHSARLLDGELWVDNSGYGELGRVAHGRYEPVLRLPGWTRGLAHANGIALVATSRVLPRFRHYAPGVDASRSMAGLHAIDLRRARVLGSIVWPLGNQIFAVETLAGMETPGFPDALGERRRRVWRHSVYFTATTAPKPR